MFAEVRPNFGRIVSRCRAEPSRTFGRILRPNFGVCRTSAHLYCGPCYSASRASIGPNSRAWDGLLLIDVECLSALHSCMWLACQLTDACWYLSAIFPCLRWSIAHWCGMLQCTSLMHVTCLSADWCMLISLSYITLLSLHHFCYCLHVLWIKLKFWKKI